MQFLARFAGDFVSIVLSILLIPSVGFLPGFGWISITLTLAALALTLSAVNSLTLPLMQILPFGVFLGCFGVFALMANSILLSMTQGVSRLVKIPIVFESLTEAASAGALTAVVSTVIIAVFAREYRD